MRKTVVAGIAACLLILPGTVYGQEQSVQDQDVSAEAAAIATQAFSPVPENAGDEVALSAEGRHTLRRAQSEFAMTGEDIREMAVGPEALDGAAAEGKVVISTTAIIIGLLVLILIT